MAQKLKRVGHEINISICHAPFKRTAGEWIDIWRFTYLGYLKPRTVEIYDTAIHIHIKPALGVIRLDALEEIRRTSLCGSQMRKIITKS